MGDPEAPLATMAIDRNSSISEKRQRDEILRPTLPRFLLFFFFSLQIFRNSRSGFPNQRWLIRKCETSRTGLTGADGAAGHPKGKEKVTTHKRGDPTRRFCPAVVRCCLPTTPLCLPDTRNRRIAVTAHGAITEADRGPADLAPGLATTGPPLSLSLARALSFSRLTVGTSLPCVPIST